MNAETLASSPLFKNEEKSRYELNIDGHIAFIDYKETSTKIALTHTEVPAELGGKGVAVALVEKTLASIEGTDKKILPYCPFVLKYIKKHPEWKKLVSETFPQYNEI